MLQLRRAGRVVADDACEQIVFDSAPQLFAIGVLANRRRAFELWCAIRDLLGFEMQIVGRRFGSQRNAMIARAKKYLQSGG